MFRCIKQFLHRIRCRRQCTFLGNNTTDSRTCYEGGNSLHTGSTVLNSSIGYGTYVGARSFIANAKIGRYTCIAPDVSVIVGNHPTRDFVSIHPAFYSTARPSGITYVKEDKFDEYVYADSDSRVSVRIGNDVWIGANAHILNGVCIGDGAVIGAGALVNCDIPPYAVAVGVPAKVVRYRFTHDQIARLLEFKWWDREERWLREHADLFENIDDFVRYLDEKREF